jgi:hypothetical protein
VDLIGTWTLAAFEVIASDGTVEKPLGEAPLGRIMYTADGTMSAMLGAGNRPSFGVRADQASDAQWGAAARMFIAYAGTWTRHGDVVRHQVAVSLIPDWIGTTLVRTIGEWDGGLTLTVQPNRAGGRAQRLAWAPVTT